MEGGRRVEGKPAGDRVFAWIRKQKNGENHILES